MNAIDFDLLRERSLNRRRDLHVRKRQDYASDEDVLSNFKRVAAACSALGVDVGTPWGVDALFQIHKLDRVLNLLRRGRIKPTNESLVDTFDDQHTYIDLMEGIVADMEEDNPRIKEGSSSSLRVFVAAAWESRDVAREIMKWFTLKGATVTHDWTQDVWPETSEDDSLEAGVAFRELSQADFAGVQTCDMVLAMPSRKFLSRGTWAEIGAAIALGKKVCLLRTEPGVLGCIYAHHPGVIHVKSLEHGWEELQQCQRRGGQD